MRRHPSDPISLVLGLAFTLFGLVFLVGNVDVATIPPALTWPIPLIVVGVLVITLAVGRGRSKTRAPELRPEPGSDSEPEEVKYPD